MEGLRGEREGLPSMLATTFAEAPGVDGRQKSEQGGIWQVYRASN